MKRHGNLFEKIVDMDNLHYAFRGGNPLNIRTRSIVASAYGLLKRCNSHNFRKSVRFNHLLKQCRIRVRRKK